MQFSEIPEFGTEKVSNSVRKFANNQAQNGTDTSWIENLRIHLYHTFPALKMATFPGGRFFHIVKNSSQMFLIHSIMLQLEISEPFSPRRKEKSALIGPRA